MAASCLRLKQSKLNALPDFLPVVFRQPSDYMHITLKPRREVQPKSRRCLETCCLPIPDFIVSRAKMIDPRRREQT